MSIPRRRLLRLAAAGLVLPALPRHAVALDYPTRAVRMVVGFPAGGSADIVARIVAQALFDTLPAALANIRAGKIRALAVTSKQRSTVLPGRSRDERVRAGLRGGVVSRHLGAHRHAARDRRQAQCGSQCGARRSEHAICSLRALWSRPTGDVGAPEPRNH
jgi:hypothetical protein